MKTIIFFIAFLGTLVLTPTIKAEQTQCYTVFQDGRIQLCCTYGNVVNCS